MKKIYHTKKRPAKRQNRREEKFPIRLDPPVVMGSPYSPDKLTNLIRNLEDKQLKKSLRAAVEIVENYHEVSAAVVVNPDLNMTRINKKLNKIIEENLDYLIKLLSQRRPPIGLHFLAESSVIISENVANSAKKALGKIS